MEDKEVNTTVDPVLACPWAPKVYQTDFENVERFFSISGGAGGITGIAICCVIILTQYRRDKYYRNFLYYFFASAIRRGVPHFFRSLKLTCMLRCVSDDPYTCKLMALWDNMLAVFELEILTHICIERFIDAWYTYKEKPIPGWHHQLFLWITWTLTLIYSIMPRFIGEYGKDFACRYCSVDTWLPENKMSQIIVMMFFFLRNYKPMIFMLSSVVATYFLHRYKIDNQDSFKKAKIVFWVAGFHLLFSLPLCIVKTTIMLYQYYDGDINAPLAVCAFQYAEGVNMVIAWTTTTAFLTIDGDLLKLIKPAFIKREQQGARLGAPGHLKNN